jgi:PUA domain protein
MKLPDHASLFVVDRTPVFFQCDTLQGAAILPHLRLVHRFPQAFPTVRIARGGQA